MTGILVAECLLLSSVRHPWFSLNHIYIPGIIAFFAALVFFGRSQPQLNPQTSFHIQAGYGVLHVGTLTVVALLYIYLLNFASDPQRIQAAILLWLVCIVVLVVSLPIAFFSLRGLGRIFANLGSAWAYATAFAVFAILARDLVHAAWDAPGSVLGQALERNCFSWVAGVLRFIYPQVVADPSSFTIGTPSFLVTIGGFCSGIEGMTLMMVLTSGWLVYSRRELRLSRAALLIPASLILMWSLNVVRIVVLVAIGDAGYPHVAVGGFHSEAGWILFNAVGIGFLFTADRIAWFRRDGHVAIAGGLESASRVQADDNPAAAYLMPFLAILACSLITRAASSGFEYLYPLRLVVAFAVLWYFRANYRSASSPSSPTNSNKVNWRFGWLGPSVGAAVFLLWIALSGVGPSSALPNPIAAGLAHLPGWQRYGWLTMRTLAAVVTVPIAEELAFRGYLARRILSADVEAVPLRSLNVTAILISSVAFGLMHGRMWIAGTLAGVLYALVAKYRGQLGEASPPMRPAISCSLPGS